MSRAGKSVTLFALAIAILACLLLTPAVAFASEQPSGAVPQDKAAPTAFPAAPPALGAHPVGATTCTGITDPALIPAATVYNFSSDDEYSVPTTFPNGTLSGGLGTVYVIGSSWAYANPATIGKHIYYVYDCTITFDTPRRAVGVAGEPNTYGWFDLTMQAFDSLGNEIGSVTRSVYWGFDGAGFYGLVSSERNIASVRLTASSGTNGFAFSDLTYDTFDGFMSPLRPADRKVFSNIWRRTVNLPVRFTAYHEPGSPVTDVNATLRVTSPSGATVFKGVFTYNAKYDYYGCTIPRNWFAGKPCGVYLVTAEIEGGGTYQVPITISTRTN